jgi:hypothetical protein
VCGPLRFHKEFAQFFDSFLHHMSDRPLSVEVCGVPKQFTGYSFLYLFRLFVHAVPAEPSKTLIMHILPQILPDYFADRVRKGITHDIRLF